MEKKFYTRAFRAKTGKEMSVTICRLQGSRPGPTLTLIAGQHGMEHMGPVVLRRFLEVCPEDFAGAINVCPCANPFALELDYELYPENEDLGKLKDYHYSRFNHDYSPYNLDRNNPYNMNRLWNRRGDTSLGVAGEIVTWIWDTACEDASLIIDFHCRNAECPLIFTAGGPDLPFTRFYGAQGIFITFDGVKPESVSGGNLAIQGNMGGRRAFCVEFSIQHGYRRPEMQMGIEGIFNVMKGIGMLNGRVIHWRSVYLVRPKQFVPVAAEATGHIVYHREPYDSVMAGDVLFDIRSLEGFDILHRGLAPVDGIMSEPDFRPIAVPGQHLCVVRKAELVAAAGQELDPLPLDRSVTT